MARMRTYPRQVLLEAFATFDRLKACSLEDPRRLRLRGALVLRRMLTDNATRAALAYLQELAAEKAHHPSTESQHGRLTTGVQDHESQELTRDAVPELRQTFDELFGGLALHRLTPPLWHVGASDERFKRQNGGSLVHSGSQDVQLETARRAYEANWKLHFGCTARSCSGASAEEAAQIDARRARAKVYSAITIDSRRQKQSCRKTPWYSCATDWHVDGGARGYNLWLLLHKSHAVDAKAEDEIDASVVRNYSNIKVVPYDNARALCSLAARLNASMSASARQPGCLDGLDCPSADQPFDDDATNNMDEAALEAASCRVDADPGDALLLFPGVFHRTQDLRVDRVAMLTEAL